MTVIAISRQVGSQGEKIAELIAQKSGLDLISQERIHKLTTQCDLEFGKTCQLFEKEVPKSFWARHFFNSSKRAALFEWLTFKLASQGNVVLLGRGAPVALRHRADIVKVRIVAPFELRVSRIQNQLTMNHEQAEHYVSRYGRRRRNLIESIFKVNLNDPELYDIQLNTAELSADDAAGILIATVSAKTKSFDQELSLKELVWEAKIKKINMLIKNELDSGILQQINVTSDSEGQVVLSGFVQDDAVLSGAEELAFSVEGIEKVDNQITLIS